MSKDESAGWGKFREGFPWFKGENKFPLRAYSEFMPPLRTGFCPYNGNIYPWVFTDNDPYGWQVHEIEEEYQLNPGMESIGNQLLKHLQQLGKGTLPVHLAGHQNRNLTSNIFWPEELLSLEGHLDHEQYVTILPFSLSKTKDDKGRVLWTFFGASEQGPEKAFWKSFFESPGKELPESSFLQVMQWIFGQAYGIVPADLNHLYKEGFRILPSGDHFPFPYWKMEKLPSWTRQFLVTDKDDVEKITYLLTFRPFGNLPSGVKEKYISGKLHLMPFPGSMLLWGVPAYLELQRNLYNAIQIPLLRLVKRNEGPAGIRVPQSGWLHLRTVDGKKAEILQEFIVNTYIRTNRWDKITRYEDSLLKSTETDPVAEALFSTTLEALDLYNKPMARNSQLFNETIELLLDGPKANRRDLGKAAIKFIEGGLFRYRFYFPPMCAGDHEIFWHRPFLACIPAKTGIPVIATDLLTGYMTGYKTQSPDPENAVELWPRFHRREEYQSVLTGPDPQHDHYLHQTSLNLLTLLETWEVLGNIQLERAFARSLIRIPKDTGLEDWIASLPGHIPDAAKAKKISAYLESILEPVDKQTSVPEALTFHETANREYEEAFWKQIAYLAHGQYINKDNADVVQDPVTLKQVSHSKRDLHKLGNYLIRKHREAIVDSGLTRDAEVGELPFKWETDFEFHNYGGWKANQEGSEYERNILVIIPGKNRNEAVVMADHYDTAYMADVFDKSSGGTGARISAAGADDNHSATSTLLLAAPIFLKMAKEGRLERDIWLLHLTGEEFPSDCMGARNFCQNAIQQTMKMRRADGSSKDLSQVTVTGVFVMDMIAHNRENAKDIFQIAPGKTIESVKLAYQAHLANRVWNALAAECNETPDRKGLSRGIRSADPEKIPEKALYVKPEGEVRTWDDPHSTLYNTDGMIFSDAGIPVVLFMENYDIHRTGYHDTHDTMENIDLDYGAAVSAIAIETVARVAMITI